MSHPETFEPVDGERLSSNQNGIPIGSWTLPAAAKVEALSDVTKQNVAADAEQGGLAALLSAIAEDRAQDEGADAEADVPEAALNFSGAAELVAAAPAVIVPDGPVENGSADGTATVSSTGDQRINGLLSGVKWADGSISYSDPNRVADYQASHSENFTNFSQISANQLRTAHTALNASILSQPAGGTGYSVEGFTNLNIDYAGSGSGAGTIRLANTSDPGTAYAYYPSSAVEGGDVFFGNSGRLPTAGNYDYHTVIHELGHSLGLKHGHETNVYGALPANYDSLEFSVMTYRTFVGDNTSGYNYEVWGAPQTYMMLDIAALQNMYGADFTTNSGGTTYTWNPTNGRSLVNGAVAIAPGANRIFETVWDGGGTDTYDLSNYTSNLNIDLTPGGYSTFSSTQLAYLGGGPNGGYARGNVFNALQYQGDARSLIENANGGSGSDVIKGNAANNIFNGFAGNDSIEGFAGNDTLIGGNGNDTMKGGDNRDTVRGIDGNDNLTGGSQADILIGGLGNDIFDFNSVSASNPAERDTCRAGDGATAFQGAGMGPGDKLDLFDIDANTTSGGNQGFGFGTATGKGRLWAVNVGTDTYIRGNVDNDAAVEFELEIEDGAVLASHYATADFIL